LPAYRPTTLYLRNVLLRIDAIDTIDTHALDRLGELIGGDPDALRELVQTFIEEADEIVAGLRTALSVNDLDTLRRGAHSMKSSAQDFGAGELAGLAARLESRTRDAWPSSAPADVEALATAFAAARTELRHWLADGAGRRADR